jgi:hypothetical protein
MKVLITAIFLLCFATSCDPDVAGEKINLPNIQLPLSVYPDTIEINIGDSFSFYGAVSNDLDGVTLEGGEGRLSASIGYFSANPITTQNSAVIAKEGFHYEIVQQFGEAIFADDAINTYKIDVRNDSLRLGMKFKLLQSGIYQFYVSSNFYQGNQGKSRVNPKFNVSDPHWNFFQNGIPNPTPDQDTYYQSYLVAVTQ